MSKKLECSTEGSLLVQYIAGFDLLEHTVYGGRANLRSQAFTASVIALYVPSHNSAEKLSPYNDQFGQIYGRPNYCSKPKHRTPPRSCFSICLFISHPIITKFYTRHLVVSINIFCTFFE